MKTKLRILERQPGPDGLVHSQSGSPTAPSCIIYSHLFWDIYARVVSMQMFEKHIREKEFYLIHMNPYRQVGWHVRDTRMGTIISTF